MEITLPTDLQALAEQKVASGEYASLNELVSAALRPILEPLGGEEMYADTEWTVAEIDRMMDESDARFERGEYITIPREGLKDYFDNLIADLNEKFEARQAAGK